MARHPTTESPSRSTSRGPITNRRWNSAFCHNGYGTERIGSKKDNLRGERRSSGSRASYRSRYGRFSCTDMKFSRSIEFSQSRMVSGSSVPRSAVALTNSSTFPASEIPEMLIFSASAICCAEVPLSGGRRSHQWQPSKPRTKKVERICGKTLSGVMRRTSCACRRSDRELRPSDGKNYEQLARFSISVPFARIHWRSQSTSQ